MKNKKINTNANENEIDYLDEDPIICEQNWVCISFLSTKNIKNMDKNEKYEIKGLKIRGVYNDYEEATKRAEFLRNLDPSFDIFIGEVGKWLPCDIDIEKAKDRHYAEKELNDIMKTYKEDLKCVKEMESDRKKDMLKNAKVDKDNTKKVEELRKKLDIKKKELYMESKKSSDEKKINEKNEQINNENVESHNLIKDKLCELEEYENKLKNEIDENNSSESLDELNNMVNEKTFVKNEIDNEENKKISIEEKLAKLKELYDKTQYE